MKNETIIRILKGQFVILVGIGAYDIVTGLIAWHQWDPLDAWTSYIDTIIAGADTLTQALYLSNFINEMKHGLVIKTDIMIGMMLILLAAITHLYILYYKQKQEVTG